MAAVNQELLAYAASRNKEVEKMMDEFCMELAKSGIPFNALPPDDIFNFSKYPTANRAAEKIVKKYQTKFLRIIRKSISTSVVMAVGKLAKQVAKYITISDYILGTRGTKISQSYWDYRMKPEKGLSLSDRIWNYTTQTKAEFELGLSQVMEDGIRTGESAEEIGRKVRDKLREPDMMYRRYHRKITRADGSKKDIVEWRRKVVGPDGKVRFVKEDLARVGRGVYRSSRQNALRFTGTEINMAYRYADIKNMQAEPYVIGYRILLSPTNHTCKDGDKIINPFYDMCDELTGDYPKWFLWSGWHPRCYSADSEVLTDSGWKLFSDVSIDDKILSLVPSTRDVEWVRIKTMFHYPFNGKMLRFFNRSLDCLVTPDHQMVYIAKSTNKITKKEAAQFSKFKGAFYRSCEYTGSDIESITIGNKTYCFDDFCKFMGYWLSDGSTARGRVVSITQSINDPNCTNIIDTFEKMGVRYYQGKTSICFTDKDFVQYLVQFGHSYDKYIPAIIKNASKRQISLFLQAFVSCDGLVRKNKTFMGSHGNIFTSQREERVYFTTSRQMAADLGELILKVGHRPSYYLDKRAGKSQAFRNGVYTINYDCYRIAECYATTSTVFDKVEVDYNGPVYDLELEKNHIMYIRRNGKCFWGSNCRCYIESILCSKEEMRQIARLPKEEYEKYQSPNLIKDLPQNYQDYVEKNKDRIEAAVERGTQPYWIEDNYINGNPADGLKEASLPEPTTMQKAADRHAARTPQQIADIKKRWKAVKDKREADKKKIDDAILQAQRYPHDLDSVKIEERLSRGQIGQAAKLAETLSSQVQVLDGYINTFSSLIPNASEWAKKYSIITIQEAYYNIKQVKDQAWNTPVASFYPQVSQMVTLLDSDPQANEVYKESLREYRDKLYIEYLQEQLQDKVSALPNIQTSINYYFNTINALPGEILNATDIAELKQLEGEIDTLAQMAPLCQQYDDLLPFLSQTKSAKFSINLSEAEQYLESGMVAEAKDALDKAAKIKADLLYQRQWNAQKKGKKAPETEDNEQSDKKDITEAKSYDELKQIMGQETPPLLQHYNDSVQRLQYTEKQYIDNWPTVGPALRDFFMNKCAWGHATDVSPKDLAESGILNIQQMDPQTKSSYTEGRYAYAHFAYGFQNNRNKTPDVSERLAPGAYYRCGKPVPLNIQDAYNERAIGYGDNLVLFRKSKTVATFTQDNSLGQKTIPSLCCAPEPCSIDSKYLNIKSDYDTPDEVAEGNSYTELQFMPQSGDQNLGLEYFESFIYNGNPDNIPDEVWDKFYDAHVDVYVVKNGKVTLYRKGKPMETPEEMIARLQVEVPQFLADYANKQNKDIQLANLQDFYSQGLYEQASDELARLKRLAEQCDRVEQKVKALIPDIVNLYQTFSYVEIENVYDHVISQFQRWENNGDKEYQYKKAHFEYQYIQDPKNQKHSTWSIASKMYKRKLEELRPDVQDYALRLDIEDLRKSKYGKETAVAATLDAAEKAITKADLALAQDYVDKAQSLINVLENSSILGIGESKAVSFGAQEYSAEKLADAKWFKDDKKPVNGFNQADAYMRHYAEEAWSKLDKEEKTVAYLYTSGSRYINEPAKGDYYGSVKMFEGKKRESAEDINTLTTVIEKAPALEEAIWVQHAEDSSVFEQRFGVTLRPQADQSYLSGVTGVAKDFTSCSCAKYSFFTDEKKTKKQGLGYKDVVLSIYIPKGAKGLYCEPFAHFGDGEETATGDVVNRYGEDGLKWKGQNRQAEGRSASDQVEFLLQRNSVLRITKAIFEGKRWYIECMLTGQRANSHFM